MNTMKAKGLPGRCRHDGIAPDGSSGTTSGSKAARNRNRADPGVGGPRPITASATRICRVSPCGGSIGGCSPWA